MKIYVIPLVAAETRSTNQDEGKVENVDKMGSTGIREWLSKK